MGKHVKLPGFVPLQNYLSLKVLQGLELLAWLTVDDESPLADAIRDQLPEDELGEYLEAIKEIGVLAQEARIKKEQS